MNRLFFDINRLIFGCLSKFSVALQSRLERRYGSDNRILNKGKFASGSPFRPCLCVGNLFIDPFKIRASGRLILETLW